MAAIKKYFKNASFQYRLQPNGTYQLKMEILHLNVKNSYGFRCCCIIYLINIARRSMKRGGWVGDLASTALIKLAIFESDGWCQEQSHHEREFYRSKYFANLSFYSWRASEDKMLAFSGMANGLHSETDPSESIFVVLGIIPIVYLKYTYPLKV